MRTQPLLLSLAAVFGAGCGEPTGPMPTTVAEIRITPAFSPLPVGYRMRLIATPVDAEGNALAGMGAAWQSSDPSVAVALANGTVTGKSVGAAEVTASSHGIEGSILVEVVAPPEPTDAQPMLWTMEEAPDLSLSYAGLGEWALLLPPLEGVWGTSGGDVFAVGPGAILRHGNGEWSRMTVPTRRGSLHDLWGSSGTDVFAVGDLGTVLHYDGTAWAMMPSGTTQRLSSIWGTSGQNVFATGAAGILVHYDGQSWRPLSTPHGGDLTGVWHGSGTDVFTVGRGVLLHYDGSSWTTTRELGTNPIAIWGATGANVFAVGANGMILHYDGATWSAVPSPTAEDLLDIQGTAEDDILAIGNGGMYRYDGTFWRPVENTPVLPGPMLWGTSFPWHRLWATSADVFLVGFGPIIAHCQR